jgi:hypothetical protein
VKIHVGFDLTYESAHSTPMIFMLNVHPSRAHDLITPDRLRITPSRAISPYIDGFGNKCVRILAPPGQLRVACDTIVADSGKPDRVDLSAEQHAVPGSYFGWVSCLSWRGACGWRLIGLTCSLADSGPGASGHDHLGNVG